ncbi:PAS domain S-box protein [Anaerobacillus sp. CMMVII]|uniref:two-component system sensor histidine kinase NtrB n=1 Tax=Anaerobacillus sp. CMMVII TaxID=2755588 RepID=UPI0021B78842|nr:PAS domain-containing sensor histidine kinase [Anaerobacillus sp. CMMVII]MCT8137071.1 PAS domain S-box protein [Anaerobacillus sp. CMMVII]
MADLIYEHVHNLEEKVRERTFNLLETNKELQENKELLENSKNHFQSLFTNSPVMKAIVKDNRCIQVNKSWAEYTGYSQEEILSTDVNDLAILKDLSVYFTSFCQVEHISEEHLLLTYTTKSNKKRAAFVNYVKIREANTTQYLVIALDITKQQQYEDAIAKLDRLHTISQVAASIGHEVRNPLTTIKGFTQLFLLKPEFLPYQTFLDLIIDELNRANDIISDFLSLAKTDNSIMEVASINDEINEILILLNAHALKENVSLETNFETISNVNICKNEFRQVILNIVNNAIEVSEHGDLVSIKTYENNSHVIVSISDQGKGIPKEIQDKIGEPFYTTKSSGTGLGLAVCHTILLRHSGKMTFETGDQGTTFYLHFPIAGISDVEKKARIS